MRLKNNQKFSKGRSLAKLDRRIFNFFNRGCKYVALLLMLTHWLAIIIYAIVGVEERNTTSIDAWLFLVAFFLVPNMLLLMLVLFQYCALWRVPCKWFLGVMLIHIFEGTLSVTDKILASYAVLVVLVIINYAWLFLARWQGWNVIELFTLVLIKFLRYVIKRIG